MNILNLEYAGKTGGIEKLCKDIGNTAQKDQHYFLFVHEGGILYDEMKKDHLKAECLKLDNYQIGRLYRIITEYVSKFDIEAIIVHHSAPMIWLAIELYLRRNKRAKVYIYAHNTYQEITARKKMRECIYNDLLKHSDGIIAISRWVKHTIQKNVSISDEKIKVIYNGIICSEDNNEYTGRLHRPVEIIYVGRLIEKKGVQVLLNAAAKLNPKQEYRIHIVGDGDYRKKLEEQVKELGIQQMVTFWGTQRNISERLGNADIFVHPAIWEEGFGISIIEAMSCGKICIASRKGAIPEIIDDGVNGFLVESNKEDELSKKIMEVSKMTDEQRIIIEENARKRANDFTIDVLQEKLHDFLRRG